MNKSVKILIGIVILAVIILAVAALTAPKAIAPQSDVSNPASLTLVSLFNSVVEVGDRQSVQWISDNYAADTVAVNIIRKVGDGPTRYELVRTVSLATANDGVATWIPAPSDVGNDIYVEVGCTITAQECQASQSVTSLAILDSGRYSNAASVYEAIEAEENN